MSLPAIAAAGLRHVAAALAGPQRPAASFSTDRAQPGTASRPNEAGAPGTPGLPPAWLSAQLQPGGAQPNAVRVRAAYAVGAGLGG